MGSYLHELSSVLLEFWSNYKNTEFLLNALLFATKQLLNRFDGLKFHGLYYMDYIYLHYSFDKMQDKLRSLALSSLYFINLASPAQNILPRST